jgi:hypothetical protein
MVATFFPIDEDSFIEGIMNKIKKIKNIDDWYDVFHTEIDNEVSYNSIGNNIMIINEYAGDVFEAIQLYQDQFGEFDITQSKSQFYAQLAFISVFEKFYGMIEDLVNNIDDDTDEDDKSEAEEIIIE